MIVPIVFDEFFVKILKTDKSYRQAVTVQTEQQQVCCFIVQFSQFKPSRLIGRNFANFKEAVFVIIFNPLKPLITWHAEKLFTPVALQFTLPFAFWVLNLSHIQKELS